MERGRVNQGHINQEPGPGHARARRRWLGPGPIAIAAAAALSLGACSQEESPPEPATRPAKLYEVMQGQDARVVRLPAIVEAGSSSDLTFEIAGKIVDLPVEQGEFVRAGAVIARLDQDILRNELVQARNQYQAAEDAFRRAALLVDEGAIPRATYVQRETQRDQALAQLDTARERLEDSVLRAPFAGRVARRLVDRFEYVSPQQPVVTLQAEGPAKAVVQVPSSLVAGSGSIVPTDARIILDSAEDLALPARFDSVATDASPRSLTYEARFLFTPPADLVILPGMTGTLRVTLADTQAENGASVPMVPLGAISERDGRTFVWVVDRRTGAVSPRRVEVGRGVGAMLPVTSGLRAGETVVEAGLTNLEKGMKVRPYERD